MIIKDTQISRTDTTTVLSATCKIRNFGWDRVYFRLENTTPYDCVQDDASPFAAALLLPAMQQGQDLTIDGSISAQLYEGMHAIMQEVLRWDIDPASWSATFVSVSARLTRSRITASPQVSLRFASRTRTWSSLFHPVRTIGT